MSYPFTEIPALCGALRRPRQMIQGPRSVGQPYEVEREIIARSESARTESAWIRGRVFDRETRALVAEMILNHAVMKASCAAYDREAAELGQGA